jgi:heptosyltransferase-2
VDEYAALVEAIGASPVSGDPSWRRAPANGLGAEAAALLAPLAGRSLVGLHLGAAGGSAKQWEPASFAALARRLTSDGLTPVLLGGPDDTVLDAAVQARMPVASLVGRDHPGLLPSLLGRLACLVSADTGVAHLAAALGTPTVTLFGPTDPALTAPRSPRARTVRGEAPCAPCFLATCPIDHACLAGIAPEAVAALVRSAVVTR